MKLIKMTAIAIITYLLAIGMARAQEQIAVPLTNPGAPGTLDVEIIRGSIDIRSYDGQEVIVRVHGGERKISREEREDGMRRISGPGMDIDVTERDNEVHIGASPSSQASNLEILIPSKFSVDASTVNNGHINISGLQGEIEASNVNGGIFMEDIRGSVVASTVNGRVEVVFLEVSPDTPMAFSSLNGDIDVTFPADVQIQAQMRTLNGEVFTDFDMDISSTSNVERQRKNGIYKVTIDKSISGAINGGGPKMIFKSHNGNIYIRKR